MPNSSFSSRMKIAFLRIMEAFGTTASRWASSAKLRVQVINMQSRRQELLTEFSLRAYEMWHNDVTLPDELSEMFVELSEIDDKLSILRAQQYAKVEDKTENPDPEDEEAISAESSIDPLSGEFAESFSEDISVSSAEVDTDDKETDSPEIVSEDTAEFEPLPDTIVLPEQISEILPESDTTELETFSTDTPAKPSEPTASADSEPQDDVEPKPKKTPAKRTTRSRTTKPKTTRSKTTKAKAESNTSEES